jgi:hypothetical protein
MRVAFESRSDNLIFKFGGLRYFLFVFPSFRTERNELTNGTNSAKKPSREVITRGNQNPGRKKRRDFSETVDGHRARRESAGFGATTA